jgi:dsRNA-specific ribonuclease/ERCC4-related helicase
MLPSPVSKPNSSARDLTRCVSFHALSSRHTILTLATKLVWFMAPNKALSEQQCRVLQRTLTAYHIRSLTGADDVDKWTTKELWNAFLTGVHVVVGTPAVLADALAHGFVPLSRLSLCVFDEAHRCIKSDPMNRIMRDFYHPAKATGKAVPHILALSASPVMQSDASQKGLKVVESNLDAMTITPTQNRSELEVHVHSPKLIKVDYSDDELSHTSPACRALAFEVFNYDLERDPYVLELKEQSDNSRLLKVITTGKTDCTEQLKSLHNRAGHIQEQLGGCFADWYISTCISRYLERRDTSTSVVFDLQARERQHLGEILERIVSRIDSMGLSDTTIRGTSDKARALLDALSNNARSGLRSIIFVEQRAMVLTLAHLLRCSRLSNEYQIGTFVGISTFSSRASSLVDLFNAKSQAQDLQDFRDGSKNLMIATNVLEEGIDIPGCGRVICFDLPKNLISFVQRRGRARQADSQYMLFVSRSDLQTEPSQWQALEAQMIEAYKNEQRPAKASDDNADLEGDDASHIKYTVDCTGALLTVDNARGHLHHFCAVATRQTSRYIDPRPEFTTLQDPLCKTWTASVTLPSFVHRSIRTAQSSRPWLRERTAIREAAFNAYVTLHQAGLVNNNLLPAVSTPGPEPGSQHVDQPSIVQVSGQRSMWDYSRGIYTHAGTVWYASKLVLSLQEREVVSQTLWLPFRVEANERIRLYWSTDVHYEASIYPMSHASLDTNNQSEASRWTIRLLKSIFVSSMPAEHEHIGVLLSPPDGKAEADLSGSYPGHDIVDQHQVQTNDWANNGLVHVAGQQGRAYILRGVCRPAAEPDKAIQAAQETQLILTSFPKRRAFLHAPESIQSRATYASKQLFPASQCTIDRLPLDYSILATLLPSILHQIDTSGVAYQLNTTVLCPVQINNVVTVLEAISAPAASSPIGDYNRLEYLGDSILKFCTEFQVVAQHLTYPEGFLSAEKDRIVRNSNLAKASLEAGLDQFILTRSFTGKKWKPPYLDEVAEAVDTRREMSSKVLADVVEALIGAAYVDGGLGKAYTCIRTLLPKEIWWDPDVLFNTVLEEAIPTDTIHLPVLERLIGHRFLHPTLLLEAITHASQPNNRASPSYERLEFFGDAVLDLIITPKLYAHRRKLRHWDLHRIHEALVNGHFLGFCCMSLTGEEDTYDVVNTNTSRAPHMETRANSKTYHLYDFVRAGAQLSKAKQDSISRFEALRGPIATALQTSDTYPWPDLTALAPEKFFSDVVEAILGAIYLDTRGNLYACEAFLEKLGIMSTMRGVLEQKMETCFPKERVGILADREEVRYVVQVIDGEVKTWECAVVVGEREVGRVSGCDSREEAEVRAADVAARGLVVGMGGGRRVGRRLNVYAVGEREDQGMEGPDQGDP